MYEVDSATFEVHQAHTWYSNVSEYATLTGGPSWHYEVGRPRSSAIHEHRAELSDVSFSPSTT